MTYKEAFIRLSDIIQGMRIAEWIYDPNINVNSLIATLADIDSANQILTGLVRGEKE